MRRVELSVRSPTAASWLVCAAGIICTGELYYEVQKPQIARILGQPFTDGELFPIIILLSLLTISAICWLLSLYWSPGKITFDRESRILTRLKSKWFRQIAVKAPIESWRVEITYFSQKDKDNKHFKKVLLGTKTHAEIILFADLHKGEALIQLFEELKEEWGNYVVTIEAP